MSAMDCNGLAHNLHAKGEGLPWTIMA